MEPELEKYIPYEKYPLPEIDFVPGLDFLDNSHNIIIDDGGLPPMMNASGSAPDEDDDDGPPGCLPSLRKPVADEFGGDVIDEVFYKI